MKFIVGFCLTGLTLSLAQTFVATPIAAPQVWSRIPHEPLFATTPSFSEFRAVPGGDIGLITTSPDVAVAIRGAGVLTPPAYDQVADALAY